MKINSKFQLKIKKLAFCIAILIFAFCILHLPCFAQPIPSAELINRAKDYDGKIVAYQGEVIGDVMQRGDFAWINVNDGKNAIGIWAPAHLAKEVVYTGSYKSIGDRIEIIGIFQRACLQHGGDLDIHAQAIRKLSAGRLLEERVNLDKRNLALTLAGALCLTLILAQFKPRSARR